MRRALYILSVALITAGIVIAADVGLTLVWEEPLSTVYGSVKQGQAEDSLAELEQQFPSAADLQAVKGRNVDEKIRGLADLFAKQVTTGQGIGRIKIPSIDADYVVVQGTDTASLQKGPGHYEYTA